MGEKPSQCSCGSEDLTKVEQHGSMSGINFYKYECDECGKIYRT